MVKNVGYFGYSVKIGIPLLTDSYHSQILAFNTHVSLARVAEIAVFLNIDIPLSMQHRGQTFGYLRVGFDADS